ncbi:penicillin-binding protein 2 [Myroides sp. 1354]|uniref:penicillin-binding protein 2 n=1 Tax=unclassified Myroides TaxID=2642485 RepID=UPI0025780CB6|nr:MULTISPECIES: penicillin-binding protein 2 [unclassified Myroides]MDM1044183.1 penicillin-binding protein 2 [Myroides sp. R163-1]MDM1055119.1 penicillin-binding protein 2 [Myroides sp. 1354]MDM1068416.1 penicillin-binding protein 2 [Myroides sp. 1372]
MRKLLLPIIIVAVTITILIRLFYLQVVDDTYIKKSENNALKIVYEYPERGYIFDRNKKLLVANQPSYDIMVIPREVKDIDTLALCKLLDVTLDEFNTKLQKATVYSPRLPSVFLAQLSKGEYAAFQEKIRHFNGFYVQKRSLRDYQVNAGANVFGYIRQVNEDNIKRNPYYRSGDLIGIQGVEQQYEDILRGTKGVKYIQRDRFNREIGSFKDGVYDTISIKGSDITLTIDYDLQAYGELLMQNKRGGIVAIEPKTGEILALINAPSYDPSLLVGRERSKNYTKLYNDSLAKPLYNRVLSGEYSPGSPFKILTGLIGLQEGVITEHSAFSCSRGFYYGRGAWMGCHDSGTWSLRHAIALSCNTYFAQTYKKIIEKYKTPSEGIDRWSKHLESFGLGQFLGYDLPEGRKGHIPNSEYYDRWYPNKGWKSTTTISNAIGQGEVIMTPMQLANMAAAVANRGYYYTPHIIKNIEDHTIDKKFVTKQVTTIDPKHFEPIIQGMNQVFHIGTGRSVAVPQLEMAGKTGTVENFTRINGKRYQLADHSVFVAFAPVDDPKIVIAVFIENGVWGARWAAPITSLMLQKYLLPEIVRPDLEKRMLEGSLESEYNKVLQLYNLADKQKK